MINAFWRVFESSAVVSYYVHEPPDPPADRVERAEQFVFVKDGFSWSAALFAPFWLVSKGLLLALAGYILVVAGIIGGLSYLGVDPSWITLAVFAVHAVIGGEAASLQRWSLASRDWKPVGTVVGRNLRECERRFFDNWFAGEKPSVVASGQVRETVLAAPGVVGQSAQESFDQSQSDRLTERLRQVFVERQ